MMQIQTPNESDDALPTQSLFIAMSIYLALSPPACEEERLNKMCKVGGHDQQGIAAHRKPLSFPNDLFLHNQKEKLIQRRWALRIS